MIRSPLILIALALSSTAALMALYGPRVSRKPAEPSVVRPVARGGDAGAVSSVEVGRVAGDRRTAPPDEPPGVRAGGKLKLDPSVDVGADSTTTLFEGTQTVIYEETDTEYTFQEWIDKPAFAADFERFYYDFDSVLRHMKVKRGARARILVGGWDDPDGEIERAFRERQRLRAEYLWESNRGNASAALERAIEAAGYRIADRLGYGPEWEQLVRETNAKEEDSQ